MPRYQHIRSIQWGRLVPLATIAFLLFAGGLPAQGPTGGTLNLTVTAEGGSPLPRVSVSLERGGVAIRTAQTDRAGHVGMTAVAAGEYTLLVEQIGYKPVRYKGVIIRAGGETKLTAPLATTGGAVVMVVDERTSNATVIGGETAESGPSPKGMQHLAWMQDITDLSRDATQILSTRDGRNGFLSGNGLLAPYNKLRVDGLTEILLRHPGLPGEPISSTLFSRNDIGSVQLNSSASDGRWPESAGGLLDLRTRSGSAPLSVQPWLSFSGPGGKPADNPGDSSAMSLQGGVTMGGAIKGDTASWLVRFDARSIKQPQSDPFASVTGRSADQTAAEVLAAAQARSNTDATSFVNPSVRTQKGFSGLGKLDWRFGGRAALTLRASVGSMTETNMATGFELVNGTGSRLESSDHSLAAIGTVSGNRWLSTTTIGLRGAKRDWSSGTIPYTGLTGDGIAFGSAYVLPGHFTEKAIELDETGSYRYGPQLLLAGFSISKRTINWNWLPGSNGCYQFGDLASFQAGQGTYYKATAASPVPDLGIKETGLFLQDSWQASPSVLLTAGVRFDKQQLPDTTGITAFDEDLHNLSLAHTELLPNGDGKTPLYPYGSIVLQSPGSHTQLKASGGIVPASHDLTALAEVIRSQGGAVRAKRADGTLDWPNLNSATTGITDTVLTLYAPGNRRPRMYKADLALIQSASANGSISVSGGYRHTDFLLRRVDLNQPKLVPTTGSDGRPIYGDLKQYGGLITPASGSNHRFPEYDFIYGLTGDGFVNQYEFTTEVARQFSDHMSAHLSYTYAQTKDNLVGQLSADPSDRLSPFPGGLGGKDWTDGRSDLDVPHRLVASLDLGGGQRPLGFSARYRFQSGLPFTPGAPHGVDLNGDGSGNNDPAFLGTGISGMSDLMSANKCLGNSSGRMATRNSCRDPGVHSLDLSLSYRIPFGGAHKLTIAIDAFNVIGTDVGIRDHAAVRVDPTGTLHLDSTGKLVVPLIANTRFGELLSRRSEPRLLRLGFRMEN